jgi:hypothetical protein
MNIRIEKDPVLNRWWVHMDLWAASFRSLGEAQLFVERLNVRINAPHSLSMIANPPLYSGALSHSHRLDLGVVPQSVRHLSQA